MGTVHVLEALRELDRPCAAVLVTTDKCYENRESMDGYRESDPMGGFDPYSSSKACSELASAAYRSSYFNAMDYGTHGVAVATARAGNVIGGGDWAFDRLLPDVIAAFERNDAVRIRNPSSIRPWQHVLEPLRGYLMLAERLHTDGVGFGGAWNFGPGEEDARPVAWIVEQMARLWGNGAAWVVDQDQQPHEAGLLRLDITKARARLGWHPEMDIGRACELVVDWARARHRGEDMRRYTLGQILDYQSMITGQ
jgi:CDP-glucose 4,6-dehydratase